VEYEIDFFDVSGLVVLTTFGPADRAGINRAVGDVVSDPCFCPGLGILIDHSALDAAPLTAADMTAIALNLAFLKGRLRTSRLAVVAPTDLAFGLARMAEQMAMDIVTRRTFRTRAEALMWLLEKTRPTESQALARPAVAY
jgi:hypothetical protein